MVYTQSLLMKLSLPTTIKVVLAILLFLCLLDMPYGFYQFVRFVALIGFGILTFLANEQNQKAKVIIYG